MALERGADLDCNGDAGAADAVRQQVLDTAELLEGILLEVDITTLLLSCTRVDKRFATTIAASIKLQRALWFQPTPGSQLYNTASRLNPFLVRHHKVLGIGCIYRDVKGTQLLKHNEKQEDTANPSDRTFGVRVLSSTKFIDIDRLPRLGSWRKMIPMQNSETNEGLPYWAVDIQGGFDGLYSEGITLDALNECKDALPRRSPDGAIARRLNADFTIYGQQDRPPTREQLIMFAATGDSNGNWDQMIRFCDAEADTEEGQVWRKGVEAQMTTLCWP